MASLASKKGVVGLLKQGWNEIPEVVGSCGLGILGIVLAGFGLNNYVKKNNANKTYKSGIVIMRPDDPRVPFIKKGGF